MASNIPGTEEAREVLKKHRVVIAGVGETDQGKIPDMSSFHFLSQASKLAIEDAGIKKTDVDGLVTAFSLVEHTFMHCTTHADSPAHVIEGVKFTDEIPQDSYYGTGVVVNILKTNGK